MKTIMVAMCVIVLGTANLVYAQETKEPPKFSAKVKLTVSGDSSSEFYSYTARELRSLGDVQIVDSNDVLYEISITSLKHVTRVVPKLDMQYLFL